MKKQTPMSKLEGGYTWDDIVKMKNFMDSLFPIVERSFKENGLEDDTKIMSDVGYLLRKIMISNR